MVKQEVISPKVDAKRKYDSLIQSDNDMPEADDVSLDGSVQSSSKGANRVKNRQPKPSSSKVTVELPASRTRKSSRLHPTVDTLSKKLRANAPIVSATAESAIRRLAAELAAMGKTCEELADSLVA